MLVVNAEQIRVLQDGATLGWHENPESRYGLPGFESLIIEQHRANYDLWHCEDLARAPSATDQAITSVKRSIDKLNQTRNDLVERLDSLLIASIPMQREDLPLHSETPGLMIDRLSILSLKRFHTMEETRRENAGTKHSAWNRERLAVLNEQSSDLALCLDALWSEVASGQRRFKLYRQMKMYNDASLNPAIYAKPSRALG